MDPLSHPSLLFDRHSSQMSPQWEEEKICWHGRSADVRYFSHAEISFILLLLFFLTQHEMDDSFVQIKRLLSTPMSCFIVLLFFLV